MKILADLEPAALQQPGAVRRDGGIKFQCPDCRAEGHDAHRDNAGYFFSTRQFGCAVGGRAHWQAIGEALGAFHRNGHARAETAPPGPSAATASHSAGLVSEPIWADGRALYQRVARPVAHIVEGIIPAAGTVLVTGEDKVGKTTIVAWLGLSYIYGLPFLGRAIHRAGRLVIVSEEDDGDELRDRMRASHQALALAYPDRVAPPDHPASLALVADRIIWEAREGLRVDDSAMISSLIAQITELRLREPDGPPVLLVIDSLQAVRGLLDPAKSEGVAVLKLVLRQLTAAGAVVVLIAHARKVVSGGKRTARASQEIAANHELAAEAAATIGLMAIGPRADAPVRVDLVSKRGKSGVVGYLKIVYDPPETWPPTTITITVETAPDAKARTDETDAKIREALRVLDPEPATTGKPGVSRQALRIGTKLSDKTIRQALGRLTDRGEVQEVGTATKQAKLYAVVDES